MSRVARATQQTPRLDGPAFLSSRERRDLSFGGGGSVRPRTCPERGSSKEKSEVTNEWENHAVGSIEGTRWRNKVADGQENQVLGSHYGVAPGGNMAPVLQITKYCCILWFVRVPSWLFWL